MAISLHQPDATLCATRHPCVRIHAEGGAPGGCATHPGAFMGVVAARCMAAIDGTAPMVKRFVTQSRPCPEKYIGQRIAIHAAKRKPGGLLGIQHTGQLDVGDFTVVRRSGGPGFVMLGQGRTLALPLGAVVATAVVATSLPIVGAGDCDDSAHVCRFEDVLTHHRLLTDGALDTEVDISDQLPYGDWTPGRFAWPLEDVRPLSEPVPAKGRQGWWMLDEAATAEVIRCGG